MSIWLFRAGNAGQYENKFLSDNRVYLTWDKLNIDLKQYGNREKLLNKVRDIYGGVKEKTAINWVSQIYPIAHRMRIGDWVVLPSKQTRTIHFGRITGDYVYDGSLGNPYYHYRKVEWFAKDIPRNNFDQDILYSMGAYMTVCKIHRNDAEKRIKEMEQNGWKVPSITSAAQIIDSSADDSNTLDLEEYIYDTISKFIIQKYMGHNMELLVEEILKAKGFTTFHSPKGADGGVDILACGGELGFGEPKICVQVKTQDAPVDRPTLDQLGGVMNNVGANYGLLVSWSGFNSNVLKEVPKQFFKIRLWDANDVIKQLFDNYETLSAEIKADIPLKRIWILSDEE